MISEILGRLFLPILLILSFCISGTIGNYFENAKDGIMISCIAFTVSFIFILIIGFKSSKILIKSKHFFG